MADGQTAFEKRFGKKCEGPAIIFGASVEYIPITAKDQVKDPSVWNDIAARESSQAMYYERGEDGPVPCCLRVFEDLEESEAAGISVRRFESQEVL